MSNLFTLSILQGALEQGCIYALVALALYVTFTILKLCDLSTDGCFTMGCAICAQVALSGHPILALFAALGIGVLSGFVTAFLQTKLGVESILAGIIVNTGLYTINLAIMGIGSRGGFVSSLNMFQAETVFDLFRNLLTKLGIYEPLADWYKLILAAVILLIMCALVVLFLHTRLGLSIRATGDSPDMVRASSINPAFTITVGLCIGGALTAMAGGLLGQYQKSCDINLGTGMVTIALASLMIGQTLIGNRGGVLRRVIGVVLGSCLYRFIIAIALRLNVDASCLKLVSAVIVAIAIAWPALYQKINLNRRRLQHRKDGATKC